jgi:hypothetical protein
MDEHKIPLEDFVARHKTDLKRGLTS